ncbi:MAG: hypothetical protein LQ352_000890 [Teloschistes flavicans]|nr:MAG: hypothetical protein LQ352_000890 [Teloschistes flavicans]
MSYPNQYPKGYEAGSKSSGYSEKSANMYSYDKKPSLVDSSKLRDMPYHKQAPMVYKAEPKSYGYPVNSANTHSYDDGSSGDESSKPLLADNQEDYDYARLRASGASEKLSKRVMRQKKAANDKRECQELAEEERLQKEAWDRMFPTTDDRNVYYFENFRAKDCYESRAEGRRIQWKKEGKSLREIIELTRKARLREEQEDKERATKNEGQRSQQALSNMDKTIAEDLCWEGAGYRY